MERPIQSLNKCDTCKVDMKSAEFDNYFYMCTWCAGRYCNGSKCTDLVYKGKIDVKSVCKNCKTELLTFDYGQTTIYD